MQGGKLVTLSTESVQTVAPPITQVSLSVRRADDRLWLRLEVQGHAEEYLILDQDIEGVPTVGFEQPLDPNV